MPFHKIVPCLSTALPGIFHHTKAVAGTPHDEPTATGAALWNLEYEFSSEILDQVQTKCHSSCKIGK